MVFSLQSGRGTVQRCFQAPCSFHAAGAVVALDDPDDYDEYYSSIFPLWCRLSHAVCPYSAAYEISWPNYRDEDYSNGLSMVLVE